VARPQPAAYLQPRQARQHPVEYDKIGRRFGEAQFSLVAAIDMLGDKAFRLEIINQQHRERGLVFDHENARRAVVNDLTQCGGPQFIHRTISR
jgi:hypothetical protein